MRNKESIFPLLTNVLYLLFPVSLVVYFISPVVMGGVGDVNSLWLYVLSVAPGSFWDKGLTKDGYLLPR